ncbi:MAG: hypothetical protein HYY14_04900 [Candidatus Omnitrophica bacterium]|nr:hypothetical protein [Candidatus Omnitrophota bacterium]
MRAALALSAVMVMAVFFARNVSAEPAWEEIKGDHFIVYHVGKDEFAKEVVREAERFYQRIADELGYERYSNFWQWENRVKIRIYPDRESFQSSLASPGWSEGLANYDTKEIISYAWHEGFIENLLAHEIAHLIFRDFVGFKGEVPLWLDEGVAQWMESTKRQILRENAKALLKQGELIPLRTLTSTDIRDKGKEDMVKVFYIQAAMVVGFLIEEHGSENFIELCRNLRDGKLLDEALKFAYPTTIRDLEDLEQRFRKYVEAG